MSGRREALPLVPDPGALPARVFPDPVPGIRAAYLRVDEERAVLLLHPELVRAAEVRVPLADVAGLVRSRWGGEQRRAPAAACLLVVGSDGRTLARGQVLPWPLLSAVWPPEVLAGLGLPLLPDEVHPDSRRVQRAHPGAAPRWWLTTAPYNVLVLAGGVVLLFLLFLLLFGS